MIISPFYLGVSVCLSACLQVCLWELFTRRLPWEGMAPLQVSTVARSTALAMLPDDTRRISAGNGRSLRWAGLRDRVVPVPVLLTDAGDPGRGVGDAPAGTGRRAARCARADDQLLCH